MNCTISLKIILLKINQIGLKKNYIEVLHTIYLLPKCVKLKDYCLNSICDSSKQFFISTNFPTLEEDILLDLLKRDDLTMEEIDVWNSLIVNISNNYTNNNVFNNDITVIIIDVDTNIDIIRLSDYLL